MKKETKLRTKLYTAMPQVTLCRNSAQKFSILRPYVVACLITKLPFLKILNSEEIEHISAMKVEPWVVKMIKAVDSLPQDHGP